MKSPIITDEIRTGMDILRRALCDMAQTESTISCVTAGSAIQCAACVLHGGHSGHAPDDEAAATFILEVLKHGKE